jgi:hypothetical protein
MGADGEVWYIDVNDTGYFYYNESDRDSDLKKLYKAISK